MFHVSLFIVEYWITSKGHQTSDVKFERYILEKNHVYDGKKGKIMNNSFF
jgi:hypothetical protein